MPPKLACNFDSPISITLTTASFVSSIQALTSFGLLTTTPTAPLICVRNA
jgi:hypothetical protein